MCYGSIISASLARAKNSRPCASCGEIIRQGARHVSQLSVDPWHWMSGKYVPSKISRDHYCAACWGMMSVRADADDGCYRALDESSETKAEAVKLVGWRAAIAAIRSIAKGNKRRFGRE